MLHLKAPPGGPGILPPQLVSADDLELLEPVVLAAGGEGLTHHLVRRDVQPETRGYSVRHYFGRCHVTSWTTAQRNSGRTAWARPNLLINEEKRSASLVRLRLHASEAVAAAQNQLASGSAAAGATWSDPASAACPHAP
jgi:hypothetical protein